MSIGEYSLSVALDMSGGDVDESLSFSITGLNSVHPSTIILDPSEEYHEIPFSGLDYAEFLFCKVKNPVGAPIKISINGSSDSDQLPVEKFFVATAGASDSDGHAKITSAYLSNGTINTVEVMVILGGSKDI